MARFFIPPEAITGEQAVITGPDVKHISRVLRLKPGDVIDLVAGAYEFSARITGIDNREVTCDIITRKTGSAESPVRVTLYQGLPKGDKMELVIQKSTELGVARIVPVLCERTVVRLDAKKAGERRNRWQRVAEEAAKQARRTAIPEVAEPMTFAEALAEITAGQLALMPWEEEHASWLKPLLRSSRQVRDAAILIGPEGGFTADEAAQAKARGIHPVTLGPRIMRTETAGIVAVAVVLYELGDLGGADDG